MYVLTDTTFDYLTSRERAFAPTGEALDKALAHWRSLPSDADAPFDQTLTIDAPLTWSDGDGVSLAYEGLAPDLGAYEHPGGT